MTKLIGILKESNLLSRKGINSSTIASLSPTKIIDIAETIVHEAQSPEQSIDKSIFAHSSSYSLSGGREDCIRLSCRASKINELARFALMYSDRVYIRNYFADYGHLRDKGNEEQIKQRFYDDLHLIEILSPLMKYGVVELFNPQNHTCPGCWAQRSYGPDAYKRLYREFERLSKEYFTNTRIEFEKGKKKYLLRCIGPDHLFEHGAANWIFSEIPKPLESQSSVLKKLENGERAVLSEKMRRRLQYHKRFALEVVNNISFELAASQLLGTSFLTDKALHISFLNSISNNPDIEKRNHIASKYLTSIVPFVEDVKLNNLIKLRKREEESFIQYRHALNDAIEGFKAEGSEFNEKDARALYLDVIAPRLSALEQKVKVAKKDLVTKSYRSVVAVAGAITFGIYSGFIPTEIAEMAKVVGFTKVASDILEKFLALGDAKNAIKNDELYFLWKVKKLRK